MYCSTARSWLYCCSVRAGVVCCAALIATNRPGHALPPVTLVNAPQSAEEPPAKRQKVQVQIAEVTQSWGKAWVHLPFQHALHG